MIVRDDAGAPLPGISVGWTVTAGGGTVSPASSTSDAAGIARSRRTLGPNAGTQTARAAVSGETPVDFSAVAQIDGAVNIANATTGVLTDTVGATKTESLTVTVTDHLAAAVPGVQVNWASAGGSVSAAQVATNASGQSKVEFTYGTGAGNQTATATVTGVVGSPVTITFTATAGTATQIAKTAGDSGTAAPSTSVIYTVQSRDAHGNPKGGVVVDWAVASGGGSISPAQNTTATNGNASATHTLGAATGANTATATANAVAGAPEVTFTTTAAIVTTVEVRGNNTFFPTSVTITQGNDVTWAWQGTTAPHNVTFAAATGAPADIPDRISGSQSRTFNTAGTFAYQCTNHVGMTGSVTVNP
ncbi:MAG: plastocyanin/azurin family copper-binding protein [Gemmatimonadales bacterium]|nr:plastocyanin/azurin family copper-binding protein [Gemmatimonadales bacterium]